MNWLKERRKELGLSQEELIARLQTEGLDINRSSLSNWETGRHSPPLANKEFRRILARVLKLSPYDVLRLSGFEIGNTGHTDEAERAAHIVDQLTPEKRDLAVRLLEELLEH